MEIAAELPTGSPKDAADAVLPTTGLGPCDLDAEDRTCSSGNVPELRAVFRPLAPRTLEFACCKCPWRLPVTERESNFCEGPLWL